MIEGCEGRMDCRFNHDEASALKRFGDPLFKGMVICNEDLSISFHRKKEVKMNQNWAVGFTILELSKQIMQSLFYKVIKPRFGGRASVLMSDTDSFILHLPCATPDEAVRKLRDVMDFSNYSPGHSLHNASRKNRLGLLKNEVPNDTITEFVGVKSKVYAIRTRSGDVQSRAKGVKKAYRAKLGFGRFLECIERPAAQRVAQVSIQAKDHINMIVHSDRVAFTSFDDKRYLLCNRHSVPYGSRFQRLHAHTGKCHFCEQPDLLV